MYKSFTELPIWKQAMTISTKIFKMTNNLPRKEDYGLTSQIRRSANSIGANIAEGFGRSHTKDKINFYVYARGSSYETIHHLLYGKNVKYFDAELASEIINDIEKVIYEINKIIKTMRFKGL